MKLLKREASIVLTFLLLIAISFVALNTGSEILMAADCGIGTCDCECVGSDCKILLILPNPMTGPNTYTGCRCSDGSESCFGWY